MRVTYSSKSVQITDREKEYAEKRLQRLGRYFNSAREAHLNHTVQRNWQIVEVTLDLNGLPLRAEERAPDALAAIDAVTEKLEQQVKRLKSKLRQHKGRADAPTVASVMAEGPETEEETAAPEEATAPTVVRRKRFAIKPMSVDEATLQMELLNHSFFAFLNSESGLVNILYQRRDGDYGLLELEA